MRKVLIGAGFVVLAALVLWVVIKLVFNPIVSTLHKYGIVGQHPTPAAVETSDGWAIRDDRDEVREQFATPRPARRETARRKPTPIGKTMVSPRAEVAPPVPAPAPVIEPPNYEESVEFSGVELPLGNRGMESYFKVVDAYVSQDGSDVLTVKVRVRCPLRSSPTALNQVSTELIVHGSELPGSKKIFSGTIAEGSDKTPEVSIGLPPGLTRVKLRIQYFNKAVDLPLTLRPIAKQ